MMRIGVFHHGWWQEACRPLGIESLPLPAAVGGDGNPHAANLNERRNACLRVRALLDEQTGQKPLDLLLDNSGMGLGFVPSANGDDSYDLLHDTLRLPLYSHFIDPITTALQGLDWPVTWQCLGSPSWIKAVWDRAQAVELQRFGVPGVLHLPMAAPVRDYPTDPPRPQDVLPIVSFVGGQNTTFFSSNSSTWSGSLLAGTLATAVQADLPNVSFYDAYHELYQLGEPVRAGDDLETIIRKTAAYYNAKLFYNASLCLRQRDRFVIFLSSKLGDVFQLTGRRWDGAYGLRCRPPLPTTEQYFEHFRHAAVNLNFVNGNAETGLNMRHFEITAAGGFMLCYRQPELDEHFEVGRECDVFESESDLLEKIRYYLSHPKERMAIAQAGQRRTLSQHLYSHRLEHLLRAAPPARPLPATYSTTRWQDDFRAVVSDADIVLDCGANVGQMAGAFRELYPRATIYSFEPVASVFDVLRAKCSEIGVHAVKLAVADRCGKARIHLTVSPEANSLLGFQEGNPCAKWTRVVGQEEVDVCTLDDWCQQNGIDPRRIDILKLDVQGAELKSLYGARNLLRHVKLVYLEVSFVPIYKDCPLERDVDAFLRESGFRRREIYPSDQPHHWGDALYVRA